MCIYNYDKFFFFTLEEKRGLDLDFFSKLLAQILKNDKEKRKKKKRTSQMSKLPRRRPEGEMDVLYVYCIFSGLF